MSLNVQNLCEQAIEAHGGRGRFKEIKTTFTVSDQVWITPEQRGTDDPEGGRVPVVPVTVKVYLATGSNGSVQLRVETLGEFGQSVVLINNGHGTYTIRPNPQVKKLWRPGMPGSAEDREEPLSENLVRGNLFTFVHGTPRAFLLDHKDRNVQYKGVTEVTGGMLDIETMACHILQFTRPDGNGLCELAIDTDEMLCRRMKGPYGPQTLETIYTDYRRVDGIMVSNVAKFLLDNNASSITKLQKIEHNLDLPETIFTQA